MLVTNKFELDPPNQEEISLIHILVFLKSKWMVMGVFGLIGIFSAALYLVYTPKQYEAIAQFTMAKIGAPIRQGLDMSVVEEPGLLITRMSFSTSFSERAISECGYVGKSESLDKMIRLLPVKGVANVVELKVLRDSPEAAKLCSNVIFEEIKRHQEKVIAPYIQRVQAKIDENETRLKKAEELVAKTDKFGVGSAVAYLSTRDEIGFLRGEIDKLKDIAGNTNINNAQLIAPIYVSNFPVSPKKRLILIGGLLGGLFFGLLFALVGHMRSRLKFDRK